MSTDLHTLSGAYALDALSPAEVNEFRKHLDACSACQQEVRELREAAARMGASEAIPPPTHLKALVLAAADRNVQLPPFVTRPTREQDGESPAGSERRTSKWFPLLLAAAAAAVVIAAGAIGIEQFDQDRESNLAADVVQVFEADDASTETMRTSNGGEVSVATSPSLEKMAVDTDELPELAEGRVYQLWAVAGQDTQSVGVLEDPSAGAAMEMPEEGIAVAITVEPQGGSQQPTTSPILRVVPSEV